MKKGCIVASTVIAVLIVLCGIGGYIWQHRVGNAPLIKQVETWVAIYQKNNPDEQVETSNEAWAKALTSDGSGIPNPALVKMVITRGGGKFVDSYGHPLEFNANENGTISVIGAGKDGKLGTDDDESSANVAKP